MRTEALMDPREQEDLARLKLAANHWMPAMVAALGSSYGVEKLGEMRNHEYPAGFPVRLALKDPKLVNADLAAVYERPPQALTAARRTSRARS